MARRHTCLWFINCITATLCATEAIRRPPKAGSRSGQYFSRGFELDFGNDFALDADGIPLNTPSHIRGPGFLDTGILISDLISGTTYEKGLYGAEQGAFAVAGSASLDLGENPERPYLSLTYGGARTDNYARVLWAERLSGYRATYALEFTRSDRPFQDFLGSSKVNLALRKDGEGAWGTWVFTALASEEKTDSGGATPARPFPPAGVATLSDLKAGDGTLNHRLLLGWSLRRPSGSGELRVKAHAGSHVHRIWNNWTFYARNPDQGDQLELLDRRTFLGFDVARDWTARRGGASWTHALGVQGRADHVASASVSPTLDRSPIDAVPGAASARTDLLHGAVLGRATVAWGRGWEAFAALRLDGHANRARRATGDWKPQDRSQVLGSPKAGLSWSSGAGTRIALEAGQGFRLGDAFRETQPMVRARSVELTGAVRPAAPWTASLTLYRLDLESEVLFSPDGAAFQARGPARHDGLEFHNELKEGPWRCELAWGWNRAAFKEAVQGADRVPGFVPHTGYVGVGWKEGRLGVDVKARRLGARPLVGDGSLLAGSQDSLELRVEQGVGPWTVALEVVNAFSRKTYNHEYYYASRFPGEPAPVLDVGRKPADPQTIRVELRRRF